jgi:AraC family transcriptional regulator
MRRPMPYLFPAGARLEKDNLILHASARRHTVSSYTGPSSIKTVLRGRVSWVVRGREVVVDPSSFLVLAAGEAYSMNIDAPRPVETCCAFFAQGFLEQVAADLTSSTETALDAPERIAPSLPYLSSLHGDRERVFTDQVWNLANYCERVLNPSGTEEHFLVLAISLLECYKHIRDQSARVPAMRASTRQDLFRRLLIGREYIHSHSSDALSLHAIARAACLSPYHFHRGFTQAFRHTPHDYLTGLRLAQARNMIESGSSVLEACIAVGFSSPSAFTRLFHKRLGHPPSAFRRRFARTSKKFPSDPFTIHA